MMKHITPFVVPAAAFLLLTCAAGNATAAEPAAHRAERPSAARAEGTLRNMAIDESIEVVRDAQGVPVVVASSYGDIVFAQGFLHAQERFFQMDLSRRLAAGRLSEIAGAFTAATDRTHRVYRFTQLADRVLQQMPADQRLLLDRYTDGVNAGLADLASPPPEYAVFGLAPEAWKARDTVLVQCAFAIGLSGSNNIEYFRGIAAEGLPPALYDFLLEEGSRFEAPMLGADALRKLPPIPGPAVIDLRDLEAAAPMETEHDAHPWPALRTVAASNNWAVAGWRTAHGGALLAGDPHLQLALPNTWYRMQLQWEDRQFVGASLPGSPGIFFGSNGMVAYAFTNASVDVQDYVIVDLKPGDRNQYRSAAGTWSRMEVVTERILVRGGAPVDLEIRSTEFGPIVREDWHGRPLAHRWTANDPATVNVDVLRLVDAQNVDDALKIGAGWHGPPQNLVVADSQGRVGWVLTGWLPQRVGMDGTIPQFWSRTRGWVGPLPEDLRPKIVDPPSGFVFTANNRVVGGALGDTLGRQYGLGVRAQRIAHALDQSDAHDEHSMLDLQLDTKVELLAPYQQIMLRALRDAGGDPELALVREEVRAWGGTSEAHERGLSALDAFRRDVRSELIAALTVGCRRFSGGFQAEAIAGEAPILAILEEQPLHLLPPGHDSWTDFIRASAKRVASRLIVEDRRGRRIPLWGDARRLRIAHPLAMLGLGPLPLPEEPINGHPDAVRVVTPGFGATLRIAVSPGREAQGIFHMPGGQSGLWDSANFADGHNAWLFGEPTPLVAGEPNSRFRMER